MSNWDVQDFKRYHKYYVSAAEKLADAILAMLDVWDSIDTLDIPVSLIDESLSVDDYPFDKSLDEVYTDVVTWVDSLTDYRDNKFPKVYGKLLKKAKDEDEDY